MSRRRIRIMLAAGVLALSLTAAVGCGGSNDSATTTQASASFDGSLAKPPKPVPPLTLDNSLGQPVNIDAYRGKAVLVTFIYDHCPDICPLIVSNLHAAQEQLGAKAKDMQIIAVSVDPKGDTPQTVKKFLADHQMTGRMQYLIGSRPELEKTWADWNIRTENPKDKRNPDAVEHSALIYGISGSGKVTTLYPANFKPQWIVHDVPLLASS